MILRLRPRLRILLFLATVLFTCHAQAVTKKVVAQKREVIFECRCSGLQKPRVFWRQGTNILARHSPDGSMQFNDQRMALAQSLVNTKAGVFDMLINPVARSDAGNYSCFLHDMADNNPRPQRCNQAFSLTVVARPERLVAENTSVTVKDRETEVLKCTATGGFPAPKQIQWFEIIDQASTLILRTNQTAFSNGTLESYLVVKAPLQEKLNGKYRRKYRCTIEQRDLIEELERDASSNGFYLHQNIDVEFHYPPKIVAAPYLLDGQDKEFVENETATFRCEASNAFPTDYAWFWSVNGRTIENSRGVGERHSTFRLALIREYHDQILSCTVCVSSGCDSRNYTLRVKYPPRVTVTPSKAVAEVGQQMVRFDCKSDGNPAPIVTWRNEAGSPVRKNGGDLQLNSIRKEDFGLYTCIAVATHNGVEWTDRAEVYLLERAPPVILNPLREQHAVTSASVRLTCDVSSATETIVTWSKDGVPVQVNKENGRFTTSKETRHDSTLHVLLISNLEKEDFGQYNCSAGNEKGNVSTAVLLKHKDELPFMAIIIASLAVLFTLLILIIAVVACKRSKLHKHGAYRSNCSSSSSGGSNNERLMKQRRMKNPIIVQEQNGHPVAMTVRDASDGDCKFINDQYFPPFIEMDRGAYMRYEAEPRTESMQNNINIHNGGVNPAIHDYNAMATLRGNRMGAMTPNGSYCNGCTGSTSACRKAVHSGSDLLAIIPQQYRHPSVLRFNEEVEEIGPKEDGASSYDSGLATSQTIQMPNGLPQSMMVSTLGIGPAQRVTNIDSVIGCLPVRSPSPAVNDFVPKTSMVYSGNMPIASTV